MNYERKERNKWKLNKFYESECAFRAGIWFNGIFRGVFHFAFFGKLFLFLPHPRFLGPVPFDLLSVRRVAVYGQVVWVIDFLVILKICFRSYWTSSCFILCRYQFVKSVYYWSTEQMVLINFILKCFDFGLCNYSC